MAAPSPWSALALSSAGRSRASLATRHSRTPGRTTTTRGLAARCHRPSTSARTPHGARHQTRSSLARRRASRTTLPPQWSAASTVLRPWRIRRYCSPRTATGRRAPLCCPGRSRMSPSSSSGCSLGSRRRRKAATATSRPPAPARLSTSPLGRWIPPWVLPPRAKKGCASRWCPIRRAS